jgi:hypothetical protein
MASLAWFTQPRWLPLFGVGERVPRFARLHLELVRPGRALPIDASEFHVVCSLDDRLHHVVDIFVPCVLDDARYWDHLRWGHPLFLLRQVAGGVVLPDPSTANHVVVVHYGDVLEASEDVAQWFWLSLIELDAKVDRDLNVIE